MTKMAAIAIYDKTIKIFSEIGGPISTKLGVLHWELWPIIHVVYINHDLGLTLTYFTATFILDTKAFL